MAVDAAVEALKEAAAVAVAGIAGPLLLGEDSARRLEQCWSIVELEEEILQYCVRNQRSVMLLTF